jgi:hypothetical protein
MQLVNATKMEAGYTLGLAPDGRERVVVVVKGSFEIPREGGELRLATEQRPLVLADEFVGEPGLSAPRVESDFAPLKPRCDVLFVGSAHAPEGRPADRVRVGLRGAGIAKSFDVVGERVWERGRPTPPKRFTSRPIHYGVAYGGMDARKDRPDRQEWYASNPVGVGYYPLSRGSDLDGRALPSTEEPGRPADSADGRFRPMALGPLGRNFDPRFRFAGTYDDRWLENGFPFLPGDFDPRYFQCAPPEQQIAHPKGLEEFELLNLTPEGRARFRLPALDVPVEVTNAHYERHEIRAALDTVLIDGDARTVMLSWRASHPLRRNLLELRQIVVGRMSRAWYRARELGKSYYPTPSAIPREEDGEA